MASKRRKPNNGISMAFIKYSQLPPELSDPRVKYEHRIHCFIRYVEMFILLCRKKSLKCPQFLRSALPTLLDIVLSVQWKTKRAKYMQHLVNLLAQLTHYTLPEDQWPVADILEFIKDPWNKRCLNEIFNDLELEETKGFEFIEKEGSVIALSRIRALIENQLFSTALKYLKWLSRYFRQSPSSTSFHSLDIETILEINVILAHDLDVSTMVEVVRGLKKQESLTILRNIQCIYERNDVAKTMNYVLISKALLQNDDMYLRKLLHFLCCKNSPENFDELKTSLNKLVNLANDADNVYVIAFEFITIYGKTEKALPYVTELIVKGLTMDINALDFAKNVKKDPQLVSKLSSRLCAIFLKLSIVFSNPAVLKEFILNAFCVFPTIQTLNLLEYCIFIIHQISYNELNVEELKRCEHSMEANSFCSSCEESIYQDRESPTVDVGAKSYRKTIDASDINLPEYLLDDLNVVMQTTRLNGLHWGLAWKKFILRSRKFYRTREDWAQPSKNLKYLNVDYNNFIQSRSKKDDDRYAGIEKGYEKFVDSSDEEYEEPETNARLKCTFDEKKMQPNINMSLEAIRQKTIIQELKIPIIPGSGNPATLKSLRAFRPNKFHFHTNDSGIPLRNPNSTNAQQNVANILNPRSLTDNEGNKIMNRPAEWTKSNFLENHDDLIKFRMNKKKYARKRRFSDKCDIQFDSPDENTSRCKRDIMTLTSLDLVRPALPQPVIRVVQLQSRPQQNSEQVTSNVSVVTTNTTTTLSVGGNIPCVVTSTKPSQDSSTTASATPIYTSAISSTPSTTIVTSLNSSITESSGTGIGGGDSTLRMRLSTPSTSTRNITSTPTLVNMLSQTRNSVPSHEFTIRPPFQARSRPLNFNIISEEIFLPNVSVSATTATTIASTTVSSSAPSNSSARPLSPSHPKPEVSQFRKYAQRLTQEKEHITRGNEEELDDTSLGERPLSPVLYVPGRRRERDRNLRTYRELITSLSTTTNSLVSTPALTTESSISPTHSPPLIALPLSPAFHRRRRPRRPQESQNVIPVTPAPENNPSPTNSPDNIREHSLSPIIGRSSHSARRRLPENQDILNSPESIHEHSLSPIIGRSSRSVRRRVPENQDLLNSPENIREHSLSPIIGRSSHSSRRRQPENQDILNSPDSIREHSLSPIIGRSSHSARRRLIENQDILASPESMREHSLSPIIGRSARRRRPPENQNTLNSPDSIRERSLSPVFVSRSHRRRLLQENQNPLNTSTATASAITSTIVNSPLTSSSVSTTRPVSPILHSTFTTQQIALTTQRRENQNAINTRIIPVTGGQYLNFQQVAPLLKSINSNDPVQIVYKTPDGKTIHLSPVGSSFRLPNTTNTVDTAAKKNDSFKDLTNPGNSKGAGYEETFTKFLHTINNESNTISAQNEPSSASASNPSLPKFQQAFGKTFPSNSNVTSSNNTITNAILSTVVSSINSLTSNEVLVVSTMAANNPIITTTTTSSATPLSVVSLPLSINTGMTTKITSTPTTTSTINSNIQRTGTNIVRLVKQPIEKSDIESDNSRTVTLQTPSTLLTPMRLTLPLVPRTANANVLPTARVLLGPRVVLTPTSLAGTTIRLPQQTRVLSTNINPIEPSVSSSTLEQLREFDKVLEKVKERSTVQTPTPTSNTSSVHDSNSGYLSKMESISSDDDAMSTQSQSSSSFQASQPAIQTTPIEATNIVVSQTPTQRVSVAYVSNQFGQTLLSTCPPVVVVQQPAPAPVPAPSPALSVTSQSSSSPSLSTTPTSSSKSTQVANKTTSSSSSTASPSKNIKAKSIKTVSNPLKASPIPKPQQKPQEDEGTAQRIYSILAKYAEQLRNSPDLNNKPAPRRRSNPPANQSQNSKRKKTSGSKKSSTNPTSSEMSPGADDHRTIGSEDSSCGVLQVSHMQDSPSHGMLSMDDAQSTEGSVDIPSLKNIQSDSNDCDRQPTTTQTQPPPPTRQLIIADSVVSEALAQVNKITNTTVLVPGNYLLPMSMMKSGHQITIVSGGSKILAVKPIKLPNVATGSTTNTGTSQQLTTTQVLMSNINSNTTKPGTNQMITTIRTSESTQIRNPNVLATTTSSLIPTISSLTGIGTSTLSGLSEPQLILMSDVNRNKANVTSTITLPISEAVTTSRPPTSIKLSQFTRSESVVQSTPNPVPTSNGPLLSQLCEISEANTSGMYSDNGTHQLSNVHNGKSERETIEGDAIDKENFLKKTSWSNHNSSVIESEQEGTGEQEGDTSQVQFVEGQAQVKKERTYGPASKMQAQRRQAAIERELRLQKSLSEECEDLGVDEPSASDLFPEAEILFENTNQSPPFDSNPTCSHVEEDDGNSHFSTVNNGNDDEYDETIDDDKSSSKITLNDHCDYLLIQKGKRALKNGQFMSSNSSQSSYDDDTTLITNTPLISDVTIPSPLPPSPSPEYCLPSPYRADSPVNPEKPSHIYDYLHTKLDKDNKRTFSIFHSDCEHTSSEVDSNPASSASSAGTKDNDAPEVESSEVSSEPRSPPLRQYHRKRPFKVFVYDENGVDASTFHCERARDRAANPTNIDNSSVIAVAGDDEHEDDIDECDDDDDDEDDESDDDDENDEDTEPAYSGGDHAGDVSRRSSLRCHVKRGCPCCTARSPPRTKRRLSKKGSARKKSNKKIS